MEPQKDKIPNLAKSTVSHLIDEWFKLFLHIVNNDQMLGELRRIIKVVLPEGSFGEEGISKRIPEKYTRRVGRNKKRIGRDF